MELKLDISKSKDLPALPPVDPTKRKKIEDDMSRFDILPNVPRYTYLSEDCKKFLPQPPFTIPIDEFVKSLKPSSGKYSKLVPCRSTSGTVSFIQKSIDIQEEARWYHWGHEYVDVILKSDVYTEDPRVQPPLSIFGNFNKYDPITSWYIPVNVICAVPREVVMRVNYNSRKKKMVGNKFSEKDLLFDHRDSVMPLPNSQQPFTTESTTPRYHFIAA